MISFRIFDALIPKMQGLNFWRARSFWLGWRPNTSPKSEMIGPEDTNSTPKKTRTETISTRFLTFWWTCFCRSRHFADRKAEPELPLETTAASSRQALPSNGGDLVSLRLRPIIRLLAPLLLRLLRLLRRRRPPLRRLPGVSGGSPLPPPPVLVPGFVRYLSDDAIPRPRQRLALSSFTSFLRIDRFYAVQCFARFYFRYDLPVWLRMFSVSSFSL